MIDGEGPSRTYVVVDRATPDADWVVTAHFPEPLAPIEWLRCRDKDEAYEAARKATAILMQNGGKDVSPPSARKKMMGSIPSDTDKP